MFSNAVFKSRAKGLGVITPDMIDRYGITGPNARAAGVARDIRKDAALPRLRRARLRGCYRRRTPTPTPAPGCASGNAPGHLPHPTDHAARIPADGAHPHEAAERTALANPAGQTYRRAECTRGEYGYYMVADGTGYPRRVYVRGPSYTHAMVVMEKLAVGANIADVAGLMVSLHTYPPEIER